MYWRNQGIKPAEFLVVFAVEDFADELISWTEDYGIQRRISCGDDNSPVEDLTTVDQSLIWSEHSDYISAGFEEAGASSDVQSWFVGLEPWDDDAPTLPSQLHIPCPNCFEGDHSHLSFEDKLKKLNEINPEQWRNLDLSSGMTLENSPGCDFCDYSTTILLYLDDFISLGDKGMNMGSNGKSI